MRVRNRIEDVLVQHTGQTGDKIRTDTERDYWMNAEEALGYGIVDEIVERQEED